MVKSETVTFEVDKNDDCIPWISVEKSVVTNNGGRGGRSHNNNNVLKSKRKFCLEEDMERVLDFQTTTTTTTSKTNGSTEQQQQQQQSNNGGGDIIESVEDCTMLVFCPTDDSTKTMFPQKQLCLRGGFIFISTDTTTSTTTPTSTITNNNNNNNNDDVPTNNNNNNNPFDDDSLISSSSSPSSLYVIPLDNVVVDFPPGGRRVFREHAMTDARTGYEFCLRHDIPPTNNVDSSDDEYDDYDSDNDDDDDHHHQLLQQKQRKKQYLVAESLAQRELWAKAIASRAKEAVKQPTKLRPNATRSGALDVASNMGALTALHGAGAGAGTNMAGGLPNIPELPLHSPANLFHHPSDGNNPFFSSGAAGAANGEEQQKNIDEALDQFGHSRFDENLWVDDYFEKHEDFDAPAICRTLEKWQGAVKQGLRGAVLEQYEYFVEASREMTTMGREVAHLRQLVENQLQTIQTMKEIDFSAAFDYQSNDDPLILIHQDDNLMDDDYYNIPDDDDNYSTDDDDDDDNSINHNNNNNNITDDHSSSHSSNPYDQPFDIRRNKNNNNNHNNKILKLRNHRDEDTTTNNNSPHVDVKFMEIPDWLDDVSEEISAFIKECRYTDATELLLKAKAEINDTLTMHEKLTDRTLSKKQLATLSRMSQQLQSLSDRMGNRLAESLRRKNEALRQAAKRERTDPLSHLAPLISPICLNDDAPALQLLVRLGRHHNAATAYAARRSLLLMESLQERPIASLTTGSNNNADVVIYAAQLSQSFFSCLAMAVEGFLDLFLERTTGSAERDELMEEMSSINSTTGGRNVPAGALSAIVLWCDSELAKFASVFGGSRVLGSLALAPKVSFHTNNRKNIHNALSTAITKFENIAGIAQQKNQLRAAEENGEFQVAAMLRRKIAQYQKDKKDGILSEDDTTFSENKNAKKERQDAINIAAKCIDKAFYFASENLDTIGLPLLSRLAEYMRSRLKGCESDIADALGPHWYHVTYDWKELAGDDTIMPERRRNNMDMKTIASNDTGSNS